MSLRAYSRQGLVDLEKSAVFNVIIILIDNDLIYICNTI